MTDALIKSLLELITGFLAAVVVISFHEFAHAFVAYKYGDPTAKFSGRMTLNPIKHFDPLGMIMFALVGFGWAKPVPINPNNFKNYRAGLFWTSSAGIIVNYLMAFLLYPLYILIIRYVSPVFEGQYMAFFLEVLFWYFYAYSLNFCVFNLLPFYPLDGFRIIDALDTRKGKFYQFLRKYGYYIFLGLMAVNIFSRYVPFLGYIDILGYIMSFANYILGWPITALWGLVF